jgi:hypothetical protein
MRTWLYLSLIFLAACTKTAPEEEVPKNRWMEQMVTVLPTILCRPEGFFRSCYPLLEDQCLEIGVRTTKACLQKLSADFPAALKQPNEGEKWGKTVGSCTGETMEASLPAEGKKKLTKPECADPTAWQ